MYVPRGYERLYHQRRFTPKPLLNNYNSPNAMWGVQPSMLLRSRMNPAAQATTVGNVVDSASVPILLVGLVGLIGGAYSGWKFVRSKGWGSR